MQRQAAGSEKIFASHMLKGWCPEYIKNSQNSAVKNPNKPIRNREMCLTKDTDILLKNIYRWQISTF